MTEPAWASLPGDVWRAVLLIARRDQPTLTPDDLADRLLGLSTMRRWLVWWQLVSRVSSTCRALREALLGPEAGVLWSWTYWQSPARAVNSFGLTLQQRRGLHGLLLRQAHHARSALVEGDEWDTDIGDLRQALSSLSTARELTLWWITHPLEVACCWNSLPPGLSALWLSDSLPLWVPALPQGLQHVSLHLSHWPALTVWQLARRLPHLARLEISLQLGYAPVSSLEQLSLLPTTWLCLRLVLVDTDRVCRWLRQLRGVQLHALELQCDRPLHYSEQRLLAQCHVSRRLMLRSRDPAWRCEHLPAGVPEVVYRGLGHKNDRVAE